MLLIVFELDGNRYQALNGDSSFPFSEAVSLMITAETQAELDRIWDTIADGGGKPQMCGWIKDRYGLPWQVIPAKIADVADRRPGRRRPGDEGSDEDGEARHPDPRARLRGEEAHA